MKRHRPYLLVVAALLGAAGSAFADPTCPPAAVLEGEPALVAELRALLTARGVSDAPPEGCSALVVRIERADEQMLTLFIQEPSGRSSKRQVTAMLTAAAMIEIQTRSDLREILLGLEEPPPPKEEPVAAAPLVEEPPAALRKEPVATAPSVANPALPEDEPPPQKTALSQLSLTLGGELWAVERARGQGARVSGCTPFGKACVGLVIQFSSMPLDGCDDTCVALLLQAGASLDSIPFQTRRWFGTLLAGADFPKQLGRVELRPGLGVGAGWGRSVISLEKVKGVPIRSFFTPRVEGRFAADFPLSKRAALEAGMFLNMDPVHTVIGDGNILFRGRYTSIPKSLDGVSFRLKREPAICPGFFLGLRYGAP